MILYWSEDSGQLYTCDDVDVEEGSKAPEGYIAYEVKTDMWISPVDCCVQDGDILEMLLQKGYAKPVP